VWSLLKFFALTYGVSWACFLAAVAMSHGSARPFQRLPKVHGELKRLTVLRKR